MSKKKDEVKPFRITNENTTNTKEVIFKQGEYYIYVEFYVKNVTRHISEDTTDNAKHYYWRIKAKHESEAGAKVLTSGSCSSWRINSYEGVIIDLTIALSKLYGTEIANQVLSKNMFKKITPDTRYEGDRVIVTYK